jgi:hypothetical protein
MSTDDITEADLDTDERAGLKLARLPETKLRKLSDKNLRKAHEFAIGPLSGLFLDGEAWKRVTNLADARHLNRLPRPEKTKRKRRDDFIKFKE